MRYGLPHKGSKNSIAERITMSLPRAEYFVDLFCGGCAVTHAALLSRKWKRFIINDIDGRMPKFFLDAVYGKYTVENHPEWVSREEFHRLKDSDAYIAMVWSFGNNGKDYIYGKDIEQFKRDYHRAVFTDDVSLLEPYGYKITSTHKKAVYERYLEFNRQIKEIARSDLDSIVRQIEIERLQSLQSLQSLQRLQSLQSLQRLQRLQSLQRLQRLHMDYQAVEIPPNAVIYCDPPYEGTNCGKYDGFDSERFHEWTRQQSNIFISEYNMPDDFIVVDEVEKTVLSAANGNSQKAVERLYTNEKTYRHMTDRQKRLIALNGAQQLTLFD